LQKPSIQNKARLKDQKGSQLPFSAPPKCAQEHMEIHPEMQRNLLFQLFCGKESRHL
jgi:hypothetical protein